MCTIGPNIYCSSRFRLSNSISVGVKKWPSGQNEAFTNSESLCPKWDDQLPDMSLSRIRSSAVSLSGTRNNASAKHMRTMPSSVENENSFNKASTPPLPCCSCLIASTRAFARHLTLCSSIEDSAAERTQRGIQSPKTESWVRWVASSPNGPLEDRAPVRVGAPH